MKNYLYVFEGIDGSGKTTLINALKKKLGEKSFCFTQEPFGNSFDVSLKDLLGKALLGEDYIAQYLLFAAARSYHIKTVINPNLQNNLHVISDRFFYSSLVYQGTRIDENFIKLVYENSNYGVTVRKVFFCKISYEIALQRMNKRKNNNALDDFYKNELVVLASRYDRLFQNDPLAVVLDMTLPIDVLVEKVMEQLH
jgi:dTMP kinase